MPGDGGAILRFRCNQCAFSAKEESTVAKHMSSSHTSLNCSVVRQELEVGLERLQGCQFMNGSKEVMLKLAQTETSIDVSQTEPSQSLVEPDSLSQAPQDDTLSPTISGIEGCPESIPSDSAIEQLVVEVGLLQAIPVNSNVLSRPSDDQGTMTPSGTQTLSSDFCPTAVKVEDPEVSFRGMTPASSVSSYQTCEGGATSPRSLPSSRPSSRCLTPNSILSGPMKDAGEERRQHIKTLVRGLEEEGMAHFSKM